MTVYTLIPTGAAFYTAHPWSVSGGSDPAVLSDGSPAVGASGGTYVYDTQTYGVGQRAWRVTTPTIPGTERIAQVRVCARIAQPTGTGPLVTVQLGRITSVAAQQWQQGPANITARKVGANAVDMVSGWMPTAPAGTVWTTSDLANLLIHVVDAQTANASRSRICELWIEVETTSIPTVSGITPTGTLTDTTKPTLAWTYADTNGDPQSAADVAVYSAAQYGAGGFTAGAGPSVWATTVGTSAAVTPATQLALGGTFKTAVRVAKTVNNRAVYGSWVLGAAFTINPITPDAPVITAVWDPPTQSCALTLAAQLNLLTADQASFETALTGWKTAGTNCTASRVTTAGAPASGQAALQLSATGAGSTMSSSTQVSGYLTPVVAGTVYSARGKVKSAAVARSARLELIWLQANGTTSAGAATVGTNVTTSTSSHTVATVSATAPSGAAFVCVQAVIANPAAAAELHWWDEIAVTPGTSPAYTSGGATTAAAQVQRSDDGGTTWIEVRGDDTVSLTGPTGRISFNDYEGARGVTTRYRGRAVVTYPSGEVATDWSTTVTAATVNDGNWWLKDPTAPGNNVVAPITGDIPGEPEEQVEILRPLGRATAVVVSGLVGGDDGNLDLFVVGAPAWTVIKALLVTTDTLLLQSPHGDQKYIRITKRSWTLDGTPAEPRRSITVDYVEVDSP